MFEHKPLYRQEKLGNTFGKFLKISDLRSLCLGGIMEIVEVWGQCLFPNLPKSLAALSLGYSQTNLLNYIFSTLCKTSIQVLRLDKPLPLNLCPFFPLGEHNSNIKLYDFQITNITNESLNFFDKDKHLEHLVIHIEKDINPKDNLSKLIMSIANNYSKLRSLSFVNKDLLRVDTLGPKTVDHII
eukprot:UN25066